MTVLRNQGKRVDLAELLCVATPLTPEDVSLKQFFHTQTQKA